MTMMMMRRRRRKVKRNTSTLPVFVFEDVLGMKLHQRYKSLAEKGLIVYLSCMLTLYRRQGLKGIMSIVLHHTPFIQCLLTRSLRITCK